MLRLGNLRQKVVLYKTGKFLQVSMAQTSCKLEKQEKARCADHTLNQAKGTILLST